MDTSPSPRTSTREYQRPLLFSKQLPYSDQLEGEANEMFDRIKMNLSYAVQRRELWPGVMYWSLRLQRCAMYRSTFVIIYGYSKVWLTTRIVCV